MEKKIITLLLIALLGGLGGGYGLGFVIYQPQISELQSDVQTLKTDIEELKIPQTKTWHTVRTFTGVGDTTTSGFSVESDTFRIIYRALPTQEGMLESWFGFKLYYVGATNPTLETTQTTPLVNTLYVIGEKHGNYYIKVLTWEIEQWIIEIQLYY